MTGVGRPSAGAWLHTGRVTECWPACPSAMGQFRQQRTEKERKPYECMECGKTFWGSLDLIQHWIVHTGEKPYEYWACRKPFCQRSHLLMHQKVHTGKSYPCGECGKAFWQCSLLVQHRRVHTREKPYKCGTCGKPFIWSMAFLKL